MPRNLAFNGISKGYLTVLSVGRPYRAPVNWETSTVPARPGVRLKKKTREAEIIPVQVLIEGETEFEYRRNIEDMVDWLDTEKEAELIFESDPYRTRYAVVTGSLDPREYPTFGVVTIEFLVPDPHKFGETESADFVDGVAVINNHGTASAKPIFELTALADVSHVDVIASNAYLRAGEPAPVDVAPYERETLVLNDPLTSFIGWSDAETVDNGYVIGTMAASATGWSASAFGAAQSPEKWQGPSKRRTLPESLQNFKIDLEVELSNIGARTGMIEVYMMDSANTVVAKIGLEDIWTSITRNQAKFQVGPVENRKVDLRLVADYASAWNDFKGIIRLWRDGNRLRPYFGLVQPGGKHVWVSSNYVYTDENNLANALITQIQIAVRKWPATTEAAMKVRNLKVFRLNAPVDGIPIIAKAGDVIVFNGERNEVTINGEDRKDLKDFGASFFTLDTGETTLVLQPQDKLAGKVIYKERFK